ncbi:hypothetical protein L226DRAFT_260585 [Lentinus tigrinus ALCF2SS1-7]|uniref:Uncharacterized protein n=1 Tax=Lentinus tigrinus ALCF2SS1-6 TaxID=1328759 RepID=A0A5C2RUD1_9APHY|nr:hypothetical protein L227DRAFT_345532 [Lentinus tigrinus ALCF2SS1-6]RPD70030.1 hypothetical protein L226DRAFT_260585 [Lentinus tigrinus ALCF2SS1-7]
MELCIFGVGDKSIQVRASWCRSIGRIFSSAVGCVCRSRPDGDGLSEQVTRSLGQASDGYLGLPKTTLMAGDTWRNEAPLRCRHSVQGLLIFLFSRRTCHNIARRSMPPAIMRCTLLQTVEGHPAMVCSWSTASHPPAYKLQASSYERIDRHFLLSHDVTLLCTSHLSSRTSVSL